MVEDLDELIEARLLLQEISGRRFSSFLFQGEMRALVAADLLRLAWLDAFESASQAKRKWLAWSVTVRDNSTGVPSKNSSL
jgi:hypothetical protein